MNKFNECFMCGIRVVHSTKVKFGEKGTLNLCNLCLDVIFIKKVHPQPIRRDIT